MVEKYIDPEYGYLYIFDDLSVIEKDSVVLGDEFLTPGTKTSLNGFFSSSDVEFLGFFDGKIQFKIGEDVDLFGTRIFCSGFLKVSDNRIATVYKPGTARDYHFKNGSWR